MSSENDSGYRVLFIIDATGSMGAFLNSLTVSLYQVASIMKLTSESKSNIGVLWYRDYDQPAEKVTNFSGYTDNIDELLTFLADLRPDGGADSPEATKTALNVALDMDLIDAQTIVLLYADAPPHHSTTGGVYHDLEKSKVKVSDWIELCQLYKRTRCRVYPIINIAQFATASFYILLSHYTGARTLYLTNTNVQTISKSTINLFLSLCRADYESTDVVKCLAFTDLNTSLFLDEDHAQYDSLTFLPHVSAARQAPIDCQPFDAEPVDFMIADLKFMLDRFRNDTTYQSTVYRIFEALMTPQHVLALTHNSILGTLWRLICTQRQDDRRDHLLAALSNALNAMTTDASIVRTWLEESYNSSEEILSSIAEVPEQIPALALTLNQAMQRRELMEITRSCSPQVLRTVMNLLNHLTVVTQQGHLPARYLPLAMNDKDIFQFLPHLFAEGLKVSLRPAAIMAMLCVLSNNQILFARAERFLLAIKGKWIDLQASENYSYSFIKLCVQLPAFFTADENDFFQKFSLVGGLKINASTRVTVKQPFRPNIAEVRHDTKLPCPTCHIARSTTLFPDMATGGCVFCLVELEHLKNIPETCSGDTSHLVECRACTCLYAVVQHAKLHCEPKCYYCRHGQTAPYRQCTSCSNKHVHYDSTASSTTNFVCAECEQLTTAKTIVEHQVGIDQLISTNKVPIFRRLNLQIDDEIDLLSNQWSLFKLKDKLQLTSDQTTESKTTPLVYNKKPVLNSNDVLDQIFNWATSGRSECVTCYICCDDVPRSQMNTTCGNKSCHAEACADCLSKWYQSVTPGGLVLPVHLLCPFCKQVPNGKILKRYNRPACAILKLDLKNDIDERWFYGWCVDCYGIKKAQEKTCVADGALPELNGFVCQECLELRSKVPTSAVKYCPGMNEQTNEVCAMAIEKQGGCNHISCTTCHSHWCWLCVKTFGDAIYEHLIEAHGNYGFDP